MRLVATLTDLTPPSDRWGACSPATACSTS